MEGMILGFSFLMTVFGDSDEEIDYIGRTQG
jgi:hypothetical protein